MGKLGPTPAPSDLELQAWPVGAVMMLPLGVAQLPPSFLICRGALHLIATYPALFAIIGHRFNRDAGGTPVDPGGGQFRVPNFMRKIPAGPGDGRPLGHRGGDFDHKHASASLAATHAHSRGNLRATNHWHAHNLYVADHNHLTTPTSKPLINSGSAVRGRSFGNATQSTGNVALPGGVAASGELAVGGAVAAAGPAITGESGPANPPVLTVNFAIKA